MPDATSPSGLSSLYKGEREHVIPIPEVFRFNGDGGTKTPGVTLIVPRHGPIFEFDPDTLEAFSVQYVGSYATRELDAFLKINRASNLGEFAAALQFFDVGSQNFVYGDDKGNIAYFTAGEMPLREDLQAGTVTGAPPWFIRDGQGGNEWLPRQNPQPRQSLPYEILPFSEMPKIVNPPAGWFVNANNDPAGLTLDNNPLNTMRPGGGLLYLAYSWDRGFRAGRITQRLQEYLSRGNRKISFDEMQAIQADVVLRDAEYFTPWIVQAFKRGKANGANATLAALATDSGVAEAVGRLKTWDFSTPTGLEEGWDAGKPAGERPRRASVDASVAASIYSVWRSYFIANTIDSTLDSYSLDPNKPFPKPGDDDALAALKNLLDRFATRGGKGASGVDFFVVPGVANAADRRDVLILQSVKQALELMASEDFKEAFNKSENQEDYRWGKLHRIVFGHLLGEPFSIPPAGGAFPPSLPGLNGISTDGGFQTVDAATHSLRIQRIGADPGVANVDSFMFDSGPVRRFVGETRPLRPRAESIWPGGTSGVLDGNPYYFQFLEKWLANEAIPLHLGGR
ncbi:MAG: penicillin acylase family protein [Sulfuritalea sp.]|nr:penicillin acylase family protein [Sulfuritalea sp.]